MFFFVRQERKDAESRKRETLLQPHGSHLCRRVNRVKKYINDTNRHMEAVGVRGKRKAVQDPLLLGPNGARGKASPLRIRLMRSSTG